MITLPMPWHMSFDEWANELRKQDSSLPHPPDWENWRKFAEAINLLHKYQWVTTAGYSTWRDWANAFILINQGD